MGSKRLQNAAAAAGFAMVNPEGFAGEATPVLRSPEPASQATPKGRASKSWLIWDYTRLTSGKASA
ncbi:MAG: hypothetical protein ACI9XZ_000230 [Alphaproteobacteria bacterium]|jgi:hypothetical protein